MKIDRLESKTSNELFELLTKKYPARIRLLDKIVGKQSTPKYIDPSMFHFAKRYPIQAINTTNWRTAGWGIINNKYTGKFIDYETGLLNNDDELINELLNNNKPLIEARPPTIGASATPDIIWQYPEKKNYELNEATSSTIGDSISLKGGGRRRQRQTKVKSKKLENKRRTRSRK